MIGLELLVATALVGVDFGWHKDTQGRTEYLIQIEPALVEYLKSGKASPSVAIDPAAGNVEGFRISVGTDPLPRGTSGTHTVRYSGDAEQIRHGLTRGRNGESEYTVQIPPDRLDAMSQGKAVSAAFSNAVQTAERIRIRIGEEAVNFTPAPDSRGFSETRDFQQAQPTPEPVQVAQASDARFGDASRFTIEESSNAPRVPPPAISRFEPRLPAGTTSISPAASTYADGSTQPAQYSPQSSTVTGSSTPQSSFPTAPALVNDGRTNYSGTNFQSPVPSDQDWRESRVGGNPASAPQPGNTYAPPTSGGTVNPSMPPALRTAQNNSFGATAQFDSRPGSQQVVQAANEDTSPPARQQPSWSAPVVQPNVQVPTTTVAANLPGQVTPQPQERQPLTESGSSGTLLFMMFLALFTSIGANLYLGWLAWGFFWRYREIADDRARHPTSSNRAAA